MTNGQWPQKGIFFGLLHVGITRNKRGSQFALNYKTLKQSVRDIQTLLVLLPENANLRERKENQINHFRIFLAKSWWYKLILLSASKWQKIFVTKMANFISVPIKRMEIMEPHFFNFQNLHFINNCICVTKMLHFLSLSI